ncbi:PIR Superfamily Protein [Plasmodium ovale curtisi]|uniref:PIR Superfamily Protein n=1 Tax=Plasmodium ovale curtisi TaxID=864141 RepID=A0A1A8WD89_PLAOA|nr:PIR Superfamily Protein [Plasmodium ovale curtisi]
MSSYRISECTLNENDLPALAFNNKWKENTKFIEFENAANLNKKIDNMQNWIYDFDGQLLSIYKESSTDEFIPIQDKRCRDLNYYLNYVLHYIPIITKDTENVTLIKERFQNFVQAIFTGWIKFKCKREQKVYVPIMFLVKELDDYCENKNAFREKILKKYDKATCCKYAKHVNEMKRSFHKYISIDQVKKDDASFNIAENCALKNFGKTFPNVICNNDNISEIETDELQIPPGYEHLTHYQQPMLNGTYPESSINTAPTKIALVSVSTILGACLSGLYLYRHSFVGSMLRNFQNRNGISNKDTYDDVNGMFSEGDSNYLDNLQKNNRFHISYDPMNK